MRKKPLDIKGAKEEALIKKVDVSLVHHGICNNGDVIGVEEMQICTCIWWRA